jgi:predicted naringenin-chalcone synthase
MSSTDTRPATRVVELDVSTQVAGRAASADAMTPTILGLGVARPAGRLDARTAADHAAARCGPDATVQERVHRHARRAGIRRRASVIADELDAFYPRPDADTDAASVTGPGTAARMERYARHAPPLAVTAARRALRCAGVDPRRITHLVLVSCTGFASPGVDHAVIEQLELNPSVQRTTVGFMGCHGALNGLRTAAHAVRAEPGAIALLVAVELCSLHFAYGDHPQRIVANTLFADGAAAMIVGPAASRGPRRSERAADGRTRRDPAVLAHGSAVIPQSGDLMSWRIGDDGFLMTLEPRVPAAVEEHLGPWLDEWLGIHGLRRSDVARFIVHPGGPRILDAAERSLGLPRGDLDASRAVLAACGNMSSPTVLFALRRTLRHEVGGPIVLVGLGPGLSIEATLLG